MRIGLYSELARQMVVVIRDEIAAGALRKCRDIRRFSSGNHHPHPASIPQQALMPKVVNCADFSV